MSTFLSRRLTILTLCALFGLTGISQGKILVQEADGGENVVASSTVLSAMDILASRANFRASSEDFERLKANIHQDLSTLGFSFRWQQYDADSKVSMWYSSALDTSVICIETGSDQDLIHAAYAVPGRISRHGYFFW